jgi:hypothetical protein
MLRRSLTAAVTAPTAAIVAFAPPAPAATVLVAEGMAQPTGAAQTSFRGAFCQKNTCRSINNARGLYDAPLGSRQLQYAIDSTRGDIIVMAYSIGAASTYDRMRNWEANPAKAPDPARVKLIVTLGNPENKFGGIYRNDPNTGLPETQPYQHLDVTMQYDSVADQPTRLGIFSMINTAFARHFAYFEPTDIDDPDNLIYRDPDGTTYMLIRAEVLPMLAWIDWFATDEVMAELDATFRPLVERDYDRPAYVPQGEGADWGNGNPPPIADEGSHERSTTSDDEEPEEDSTTSDDDDESPGGRHRAPDVQADVPADAQEPADEDQVTADLEASDGDSDTLDESEPETALPAAETAPQEAPATATAAEASPEAA